MNSPIKIGKVLKKYRQELDITLEKLADNLFNISRYVLHIVYLLCSFNIVSYFCEKLIN